LPGETLATADLLFHPAAESPQAAGVATDSRNPDHRSIGRSSSGSRLEGWRICGDLRPLGKRPALIPLASRLPGRERCTLIADDEKEPAELRALGLGEAGEQLVFGVALRLRGAFELPFTGSGECDDVPAAVGWIAFAREVAVSFERVEQGHEDARVDVHDRAELALGHRATIVQESEQVELSRRQPVLGVRRPQSPHRLLAQEREQESLARGALFE
jgi:hypothetical protein